MTVKPLVAATDGSDESLRAVEWAAGEAMLRGAPLRIVAAASPPPRLLNLMGRPDSDFVAGLIGEERDRALAAAAARAAELAPGLRINTVPLAACRRRRSPKADPARRCWSSEPTALARSDR